MNTDAKHRTRTRMWQPVPSDTFVNRMTVYACQPLVRLVQGLLCRQRGRANSNVVSVYYHCVSDATLKHLKYLYRYKSVGQFTHDLEVFTKAFEPLTIDDFLSFSESGARHRKQPILITFDDGLREVHDIVAPLLLRKGIPATFFVTRDFVDNRFLCYHHRASLILDRLDELSRTSRVSMDAEVGRVMQAAGYPHHDVREGVLRAAFVKRPLIDEIAGRFDVDLASFLSSQPYLTSAQLRRLREWGFGLGGHGIDHSHYPQLSLEEQLRQTEESVMYLKKELNVKYGVFSFPHGEGGVSKHFFKCLRRRRVVDLCFGIRGFVRDGETILHQRLCMERTDLGAESVILRHLFRAFGKVLIGRSVVGRN